MKIHLKIKEPKPSTENLMLVNFYYSAQSTESGGEFYELVLSSWGDSKAMRLDSYLKEDVDSHELKTSFLVPCAVLDECTAIIKRNKLHLWNDMKNAVSTDGEKIVCKYWDGKGYIRVSNESMPTDGESIMYSIRDVMRNYLKEEWRISDD